MPNDETKEEFEARMAKQSELERDTSMPEQQGVRESFQPEGSFVERALKRLVISNLSIRLAGFQMPDETEQEAEVRMVLEAEQAINNGNCLLRAHFFFKK